MLRVAAATLAAGVLLLCSCASPLRAPVQPPTGALVTVQKAPLQVDMEETRLGPAHGTASSWFVQDPIFTGINLAWGDASVESAAREGGLETVSHTDYEQLSILFGIVQRLEVQAYGD